MEWTVPESSPKRINFVNTWFQNSPLQNRKMINFYCSKTPILWLFQEINVIIKGNNLSSYVTTLKKDNFFHLLVWVLYILDQISLVILFLDIILINTLRKTYENQPILIDFFSLKNLMFFTVDHQWLLIVLDAVYITCKIIPTLVKVGNNCSVVTFKPRPVSQQDRAGCVCLLQKLLYRKCSEDFISILQLLTKFKFLLLFS